MTKDPFLSSSRSEIDRLFDTLVHRARGRATPCWTPAADVTETPESYWIEIDLPGVASTALSVTAEDGVLSIRGTRERVRRAHGERSRIVERICGRFQRVFRLPHDADPEDIRARLREGVLTVEIPKVQRRSG